jgi:UDP-2-acetamido-3-amino-2,3-dideoxy-glucuronate N-acetyltransferase
MPDFFVHPLALCESTDIGKNTRIWAFSHVMKDVKIGEDCNFGDHSFVESNVNIGNRVTVKNGVAIWHGVTIEDDVFLGPNCVLTNDLFPRSKAYHSEDIPTLIKKGASIGANATIICGITIGEYAMVGAGAVVKKNVLPFNLVAGVPARVIGYVSLNGDKLEFDSNNIARDSSGNYYRKENEMIEIIRDNK